MASVHIISIFSWQCKKRKKNIKELIEFNIFSCQFPGLLYIQIRANAKNFNFQPGT